MDAAGEANRVREQDPARDERSASDLLAIAYPDLHRLAASYMRRERRDHTLQPTALVHEVYLKLVDQHAVTWRGRAHFLAVAAEQMRRILVDHARAHGRLKRGGGRIGLQLDERDAIVESRDADLLALDEALGELGSCNPQGARIATLRYFGGLSNAEVAAVLGVSVRTVERKWEAARRWLSLRLEPDRGAGREPGPAGG